MILDELPTTTRIRTKPRLRKIDMPDQRVRWRMTLDELCYAAKIPARTFDDWAAQGILGKRHALYPDQGRGRHITRELAQKTVLVARLVAAGLHPLAAGHVAQGHKTNDTSPLTTELSGGIEVTIDRSDLP